MKRSLLERLSTHNSNLLRFTVLFLFSLLMLIPYFVWLFSFSTGKASSQVLRVGKTQVIKSGKFEHSQFLALNNQSSASAEEIRRMIYFPHQPSNKTVLRKSWSDGDPSMHYMGNEQRRLINDIFDNTYYDRHVLPVRDHSKAVKITLSMSLYQLLDVDEHSQSITVNVWMVQEWKDDFINWKPEDYGGLTKTIVRHDLLWLPDTYLYNSEMLEQKKTESIMHGIVTAGSNGSADVQLLFPAIYKLSCKMNVQFFPYDEQNCTFIISSWTHDSETIDYWPKSDQVNLRNVRHNDEWQVKSFSMHRVMQNFDNREQQPLSVIHAHLVIKRKPLYYILNLVIPTSIITIVAVTGFFTPTSSSSERDEKLYLGINTLLTMSIMMLMVCNQMPSTSTYVPLMSWYYIGIIFVIVTGTLLATIVLSIHGQKHYMRPLSSRIRNIIHNKFVGSYILEVPTSLIDLWTEYGIIDSDRTSTTHMDPLLVQQIDPVSLLAPEPSQFFRRISTQASQSSIYSYERRLASLTRQYTTHLKQKETERRKVVPATTSLQKNARDVKRQKMMRRCALEWEYLANVLDRILLTFFIFVTFLFFALLVFWDELYPIFTFLRRPFQWGT